MTDLPYLPVEIVTMIIGYVDDIDIHYSYRALKGPYINISLGLGGAPRFFKKRGTTA